MLHQEQQRLAATFGATPCSADSMNVIIGIIWWVKLNYPVNFGKVKATLGDICAQQNTCLCLAKFEVG